MDSPRWASSAVGADVRSHSVICRPKSQPPFTTAPPAVKASALFAAIRVIAVRGWEQAAAPVDWSQTRIAGIGKNMSSLASRAGLCAAPARACHVAACRVTLPALSHHRLVSCRRQGASLGGAGPALGSGLRPRPQVRWACGGGDPTEGPEAGLDHRHICLPSMVFTTGRRPWFLNVEWVACIRRVGRHARHWEEEGSTAAATSMALPSPCRARNPHGGTPTNTPYRFSCPQRRRCARCAPCRRARPPMRPTPRPPPAALSRPSRSRSTSRCGTVSTSCSTS